MGKNCFTEQMEDLKRSKQEAMEAKQAIIDAVKYIAEGTDTSETAFRQSRELLKELLGVIEWDKQTTSRLYDAVIYCSGIMAKAYDYQQEAKRVSENGFGKKEDK